MLKAVIFDMNGVIIDDERIHQESWRQLGKKYKFNLTEENFKYNVFGKTEKDVFNYLFKRSLSNNELEKYSSERVKIVMDMFRSKMAMTSGFLEFCESLRKNNILLAIATSSRKQYTNFILDGLAIRYLFQKIVTAEDILRGKPDPEIYLLTAKEMQIKPEECVVFEDTISGIKSGKSANMKVIAITTTHTAKELSLADITIGSFNDMTIYDLQKLFA